LCGVNVSAETRYDRPRAHVGAAVHVRARGRRNRQGAKDAKAGLGRDAQIALARRKALGVLGVLAAIRDARKPITREHTLAR
jgi:hypothetical protein